MAVNVRKMFNLNCGPQARYIGHRMRPERDGSRGYPTVVVAFSVGKRKFELDGVIWQGDSSDDRIRNAVLKIASIAKNVNSILAAPDGAGEVKVERQLS